MEYDIKLFSVNVGVCNRFGWTVDLYSVIVADCSGFGCDEDIYSDIVVWLFFGSSFDNS